jgi:hypothetical protein
MAEDFQWAIKTGDLNGVREFVEVKKHDVNAADATVKRRTPLHYAADFGQGSYSPKEKEWNRFQRADLTPLSN